jgi:hypothetical protein
MGINVKELQKLVIIPTLEQLANRFPYNDTALTLVMETMYHESAGFVHIIQMPNYGPANGILQMEKTTFDWLVDSWIPKWPEFAKISPNYPNIPLEELYWNLKLNVAMCRARYYVSPKPLPANNLESRSEYWFTTYNNSKVITRKQHYQIHAKELDKLLL